MSSFRVFNPSVTLNIPDTTAITLADSSSIDAFSRLRVSNPTTVFEMKAISDNMPLFWDDSELNSSGAKIADTNTSSTYNTNQASITLSVDSNVWSRRVRQTKLWHPYQAGKSQLIMLTGDLGEHGNGITTRMGLYNDNNGFYFANIDGVLYVAYRTYTSGSAVDYGIEQKDWNIDKCDGSGSSGFVFDPKDSNIFVIDFQWLGVGRIRYGFDVDGVISYCHEINNANIRDTVYLSNPCLPVRYEIVNDGTGSSSTITAISVSVASEGGIDFAGTTKSVDRGVTGFTTTATTNLFPVFGIRLKPNYLHGLVNIQSINILCTTATNFYWALILNPTITGTALSYTNVPNSCVQACLTSTNASLCTVGTGTIISSGYDNQTKQAQATYISGPPGSKSLKIGSQIDGTPDEYILAIMSLGGTAETFYVSVTYEEIY